VGYIEAYTHKSVPRRRGIRITRLSGVLSALEFLILSLGIHCSHALLSASARKSKGVYYDIPRSFLWRTVCPKWLTVTAMPDLGKVKRYCVTRYYSIKVSAYNCGQALPVHRIRCLPYGLTNY